MFMGEYNHTVDTKGRLIVPSKFRDQLGDEFVVTKGLDGCLFVYPSEEWKAIEEKFRSVSQFSQENRKFARFFFAGATTCEVDKQGRILLASNLKSYANLDKDVVIIGQSSYIEIWSAENWNAYNNQDEINLDELVTGLSEYGL